MEGQSIAPRLGSALPETAEAPRPEPLELRFPAIPESVAKARRAVSGYARPLVADADAVALAVSEIVTNAVVHAYPAGEPGSVWVSAEFEGEHLTVTVADDGSGMRPIPETPGLAIGLPLVGRLALGLNIEPRQSGGTRLRMRFRCAGAGAQAGD
jgi:serine/threonine-protein kinase RsbW